MWNKFSLKVQLILFMIVLVILIEGVTLFVIHKFQKENSMDDAKSQVVTLTKSLNNDLIKVIFDSNAYTLADITLRLNGFTNVNGLILLDSSNNEIFEYKNTKDLHSEKDNILKELSIFNENSLHIKSDLSIDGFVAGYTLIDIDLSAYKVEQEEITKSFMILFPISIIFALFISIYLSRKFISPFKDLTYAMDNSNPMQGNVIKLQTQCTNEIGTLYNGFNQQMEQIQLSNEEVIQLTKEIEDTQREVVFTMGAIGESRSKETGNHVKRVAKYSELFALYSGLSSQEAEMLKQASPMHDIGKVAIPDNILNKPGRFDDAERKIMDTHAQLGYDMLKSSNKSLLKLAATVAYEHHEKWDGSGYPNGLKGEEININGRITAIADVFDALGSNRVYKQAWDDERIFKLFKEERAKHFDPNLVDIFFANLDEFLTIRDEFKDKF